ncbi:DNA repair and recombination protein pif1 [Histoplasma capsulatum G186AR]|uniref:ATP-dependent DNA helicase PIF1 n=2 Tax=Ajellomyces capsulatus TaxID=5037 RepID=C0NFA5_AJECG|nr:DNA repair and recombination protein pif1 [Histoplasma capsulatum G186AR]EEH09926.1 DNA repair and recombination protein pif1 [Histoplasma capsulatum G186AR]KAG5298949.1 DNA repair and recombination protein pif1 [Histoplasma capsulatum]QSS73057.1 DNA repair and recombination protein pif1 [Histoplasma capsulatum G186AR]
MSRYALLARGSTAIVTPSFIRLASRWPYSLPSHRVRKFTMFNQAVRNHTAPARPLLPKAAPLNRATPVSSSQQAGFKRKLDAVQSTPSETPLAILHSNVYFDENDFDDDIDLDEPTSFSSNLVQSQSFASSRIQPPELPPPLEQPAPPSDNVAPPSTIPLPWSSSPPANLLPPAKRRALPWQADATKSETERRPRIKQEPKTVPRTPASNKTSSLPWDKTMSAVKEQQKELRKQQKTRISSEKNPTHVGTRAPKVASIFLSEEQKRVVEAIVKDGKSIFFTGSAGTGKSVLMREIIKKLREKYRKEPDRIAVTASTGLAACNIEGVTLHSFAGIGLGKGPVADLVKKVKQNQKNRTRWLRTKVLVIDEISMVDGDLFDKLEEIARKIRNNGRPFGGIQLVVTGDFFQLPPVPDSTKVAKFAFSASTWNTTIQHTILLTHVFRQKDPKFAGMLNEMRLGKLSPETIAAFKQLSRPLNFHDSLEATELFPTRSEVENANSARMARLSGETMVFTAVDGGTMQNEAQRSQLLADCVAPTIQLKKGAQVMLIKNMDESLVNGSLGKVVAFMDEARFDYYTKNDEDFAGDPSHDDRKSQAINKVRSYENKIGTVSTNGKWPVVCFVQPDGTERHLLCQPETWKIELPNGEVRAQRTQVPLILAWALSIHKAQGQTLQRVKVDLGRVFEKGQAYVALSRATSQAGLQVSRFDPRRVMVHPKVLEFYSNLSTVHNIKDAANSKANILVDGNNSANVDTSTSTSADIDTNAKPSRDQAKIAKRPSTNFSDDFDDDVLERVYA